MPLTAKGQKILAAMQKEYGEEEGKRVFYASKNAGKITGVDAHYFESNDDLPKRVRSALPAPARTIFRKAFNDIMLDENSPSEERGFKMAWCAVMDAGWSKDSDGEWVHDSALDAWEESKHLREKDGKWTSGSGSSGGNDDDGTVEDYRKWRRANRDSKPARDSTPIEVHEMIALDAGAKVRKTKQGFLVATPRVARAGIQVYKGREVGRPEMDEVRVYRPEKEVFAKAALASFARLPVTLEHPPVLIDSTNWRKYTVGHGDPEVIRDGQFVRVPIMVTDSAAVKAYDEGKVELSAGYTMDLAWEKGTTEAGEAYDAVQTEIRGNHIALVDAARGGSQLRIGDEGEPEMKTIVVDGLEVEVSDMAAKVVTRALDNFEEMIEEKKKKAKKDEEEKAEYDSKLADSKKQIEAKDAEIATLKQQLKDAEVTPAKLDGLVKDRAAVIGKAKALLGDKLVIDGKSVDEMRKQAVDAKLGAAAKDWTADQVRASFDSLAATQSGRTQLDNVISDGIHQPASDAREAAYDSYVAGLQDAWKRPAQSQ